MDRCQPNIEILINKYIDGEITAREMEDLRTVLEVDPAARGLFEKMQRVDRYCQDAIQRYVLQAGRPVEDVLAGLGHAYARPIRWVGLARQLAWSRFAAGLAAGLLIGLLVSVTVFLGRTTTRPVLQPQVVNAGDIQQHQPLPRVNIYYFRDSQGNLWAIEGLSEERVRNVAYQSEF